MLVVTAPLICLVSTLSRLVSSARRCHKHNLAAAAGRLRTQHVLLHTRHSPPVRTLSNHPISWERRAGRLLDASLRSLRVFGSFLWELGPPLKDVQHGHAPACLCDN